ncbi:hypothetical protein MJ8_47000 [Mesorhizobium sp. J8]|nr:hypothetical protein MJ8_47000 [Mesorhizobium sp. J8]
MPPRIAVIKMAGMKTMKARLVPQDAAQCKSNGERNGYRRYREQISVRAFEAA